MCRQPYRADEAEIENLAGTHFFDSAAEGFLGKFDGASHPMIINRSVDRLASQIKIIELLDQRGVLNAQVWRYDF
jgi:hypothetical protein